MPHMSCFFFFNDTATTEIYTLSLHDALPIYSSPWTPVMAGWSSPCPWQKLPSTRRTRMEGSFCQGQGEEDRKSTRLNSSHGYISYAVFCLKKKNYMHITIGPTYLTANTS